MHSYFLRLNVLFFFSLSCLAISSIFLSLSTFSHSPPVAARFSDIRLSHFRNVDRPYFPGEKIIFQFSLDSDLSPLWHWNCKQLFAWVQVKIIPKNSSTRIHHGSSVWDSILLSTEESKLKISNGRVEYPLSDHLRQLRGATIEFQLWVDQMPIVGPLKRQKIKTIDDQGNETNFTMKIPENYF